jgi:hypothetical protein
VSTDRGREKGTKKELEKEDKIDIDEFEEEEYGKEWMRRSSKKW